MKAIIIGAPIEIEGEPAEIAALVDLVVTGKIASEHKHRWRIAELDGRRRSKARATAVATDKPAKPAKPIKRTGKRKCRLCGQVGHRSDKCPAAA